MNLDIAPSSLKSQLIIQVFFRAKAYYSVTAMKYSVPTVIKLICRIYMKLLV